MFVLAIATSVFAAPFLVCDPNSQAVGLKYEIWNSPTGLDKDYVLWHSGTNEADGSLRMDLATISKGVYSVKARYVDDRAVAYGGNPLYSDLSTPCIFALPYLASISTPTGWRLAP